MKLIKSISRGILFLFKGDTPARLIFKYYFIIILLGGIVLTTP